MKISEIITDKYKLRIPPTVYYDLLADVIEAEEKQEPILEKIRAEIANYQKDAFYSDDIVMTKRMVLAIIDKYKADSEPQESEAEDGNERTM